MARITWDGNGDRLFVIGTDRGVLYPYKEGAYTGGVAWNGLTSVTESPSGADEQKFYADNIVYGSIRGSEDFGGTIECYTYPDEFAECNGEVELAPGVKGNQQTRKPFGFSFRSLIGNDTESTDHGYEIHLIYNATVSPSEVQYQTVNDSPEPGTMSYEFSCNPIQNGIGKPMSHIVINSTKVDASKLTAFEETLYGGESSEATLPLPDAVKAAFATAQG